MPGTVPNENVSFYYLKIAKEAGTYIFQEGEDCDVLVGTNVTFSDLSSFYPQAGPEEDTSIGTWIGHTIPFAWMTCKPPEQG